MKKNKAVIMSIMLAIFVVFNTALADLHMTVEAKGELNETKTLQKTDRRGDDTRDNRGRDSTGDN